MTTRPRYKLSEDEIQGLMNGLRNHGQEATYEKMKECILEAKNQYKRLDEICMDMYESMLVKARVFNGKEDQNSLHIKSILYQLASMLRYLAHELHKTTKKRNKRFLELIH